MYRRHLFCGGHFQARTYIFFRRSQVLKFSLDHCIELNSTEASALYLYKNRSGHATAPEKFKLLETIKRNDFSARLGTQDSYYMPY